MMAKTTGHDDLPLFAYSAAKKLSCASHPTTSQEAATQILESGSIVASELFALAWVERLPMHTGNELDDRAQVPRRTIARRLPGLRDKGMVVNGPTKRCSRSQFRCLTWNLTGLGKRVLDANGGQDAIVGSRKANA